MCWLITEYIQFRPPKKPPRTNGQKMRLMKMVCYLKKPTKYSGLEQNENKNELIS